MPPRLNRKARRNEIKFQVVRDENNEIVFRTLNAPRGVKTRADLTKHLPKDFPIDMIEETSGGKVQSRYSRESGDGADMDDMALAERLLKGMTLHDIGFDDTKDGDDMDDEIDFDDVDEIINMSDLADEFGPGSGSGRKSRNERLRDAASGNDYAYDYNKHFKPMTPGVPFYLPGQGMTADPEANQPIIPAAPAIDTEYEEDLKTDQDLKQRGEKIQAKVKKTIHSEVSGLDVPVFESSRYKFTDDFLQPLIDGDTEGYEELEDNIFELLLQSDDEFDKAQGADAFSDDEYDDFGMLSREEIIAKMRNPSTTTKTEELFPEFAKAGKKVGFSQALDENGEFEGKLMSLADFGYGDDDEVEAETQPKPKKAAGKKTGGDLKNALAGLKKIGTKKAEETTTSTTTTTTTTTPAVAPKAEKPITKKPKAVAATTTKKSTTTTSAKKPATTKSTTKGKDKQHGSDLGGFDDDDYGNNDEEEFNPDDMFGYGDDEDHTTSKYDEDFPTFGSNADQDFGYDDGDDLNAMGDDGEGDFDEDYDYYDEDDDDGQDDIDRQIQDKLRSRIMAQFGKEDGVEVDVEDLDEDDDIDYGYGEGEHYDPFAGEGEYDFDGDGAVMSDYLTKMLAGKGYSDDDDDEDYYDEDYYDEDDEGYGYQEQRKVRRGQNRDQELSALPSSDPLLSEQEYAQFQRLVNIYEQDNSTDDEEYDEDQFQDEDDEDYKFHINRSGMALNDSEVKKAMDLYNTQKSRTQKHYQNLRKSLGKDIKNFIRQSVIRDQETPQGNIDQVSKEIDRTFAKKKTSRLDVQSMRTTLSTTANVPTLIKESRVRAAKRQPGTTQKTTEIVAEAKIIQQNGSEFEDLSSIAPVEADIVTTTTTTPITATTTATPTTKTKKSVSFGADQVQTPPRQIKLDHRGIPVGVLEKHRQERIVREEEQKAVAAATAEAEFANPSAIQIVGATKPRFQLNFTKPVTVAFNGMTQQFPTTDEEEKKKPEAEKKDEDDADEDEDYEDEDYEDDEAAYIPGMRRDKKETPEERKLRKKLQKEYKTTRRTEKKQTKNLYKEETRKAKHQEQVIKFKNPAFKKML